MAFEYDGLWSDGLTAKRYPAKLRLDSSRLIIISKDDGTRLAEWPFAGLELAEELYANQPARLRHIDSPDARLVAENPAFIDDLQHHAPHLKKRNLAGSTAIRRILMWGGALVGSVVALYITVPLLAGPIAASIPASWEQNLGKRVVESALQGETVCQGTAGQKAMNNLVEKLAMHPEKLSVKQQWPFRIRVVDNPKINAFAAPGGEMVFYRGLIDAAESPNEVAAVLAHEMAHVIHHHGTESLVRRLGLSFVTGVVFGDSSAIGALADGGQLIFELSHGRDAESEADETGLQLLEQANIDGNGMAVFFERLAKENSQGSLPSILSTHPLPAERAEAAREQAASGSAAMTQEAWQAVKDICSERSSGRYKKVRSTTSFK